MEIVEEEPIMDKIRKTQRGDSELNQLIKYLEGSQRTLYKQGG